MPASRPGPATAHPATIRVLDPLVVNQIAAGEVVERPASIVKELLDNALDAGATRISVELERGGIERVCVTDNGRGLPSDQLPLAIHPHATSKVATAHDLDRIATMGFRGEALASIASVSRLSITSRAEGSDAAACIEVVGGEAQEPRPAGGPVGTRVDVRTLFFNTPARRKFLKTPQTEHGHCLDAVKRLAMAHPSIGFRAKADERVCLDLPPDQSPRRRVIELVGKEMDEQYVEAHADAFDDARGMALWGLVGLPVLARPTPRWQHVFLNGRPIRDKTIMHALREAYRGLIEPGRHPAAVLMIEMDPGAVDVNVHPAKVEVRFRDGGMVHRAVYGAVREALSKAELTPAARAGEPPRQDGPRFEPVVSPAATAVPASDFVEAFKRLEPGDTSDGRRFEFKPVREAIESERERERSAPEDDAGGGGSALPEPRRADAVLQVHNSFLVTQDASGLVIIDQHALHERVMFEQLKARLSDGPLESQRLLMPERVDTTAQRADLVEALTPFLASLGIELTLLGPACVAINAFPTFLYAKNVDPAPFVAELLERAEDEEWASGTADDADDRTGGRREEVLHEVLDMMACKAAVKAGDHLSDEELSALLRLRESIERSSNCPHGRPTAIRLSIAELERQFGRS